MVNHQTDIECAKGIIVDAVAIYFAVRLARKHRILITKHFELKLWLDPTIPDGARGGFAGG